MVDYILALVANSFLNRCQIVLLVDDGFASTHLIAPVHKFAPIEINSILGRYGESH